MFSDKIKYHINPTGKFVIGGLLAILVCTGKIIVEHMVVKALGGGGFSKDLVLIEAQPTLLDIVKNLVAAGVTDATV